jgi:hypothetical protein
LVTLRDALLPFRKRWLEQMEEAGREKKKAIEASEPRIAR